MATSSTSESSQKVESCPFLDRERRSCTYVEHPLLIDAFTSGENGVCPFVDSFAHDCPFFD